METPRWVQEYLRRAIVVLALGLGSCTRELPEQGSAAANLYRERCGSCHRAYSPASLTAPTWQMILPRMERYMERSTRGPLSAEQRRVIVDYLRRNAAGG